MLADTPPSSTYTNMYFFDKPSILTLQLNFSTHRTNQVKIQFLKFCLKKMYLQEVHIREKCVIKIKVKTIYSRGKGPTQQLYSSSRRTAVVPLFKNFTCNFFGYFSGLGNVDSPSSNDTGLGGPRTSDLYD